MAEKKDLKEVQKKPIFVEKVSEEIAKQEVDDWLDFLCINPRKRVNEAYAVDALISAVQYGIIEIQEDKTLKQNLLKPIVDENGSVKCSELIWANRLTPKEKNLYRRSLEKGDNDFILTMLALTKAPKGHILNLHSGSDFPTAEAISVFFM